MNAQSTNVFIAITLFLIVAGALVLNQANVGQAIAQPSTEVTRIIPNQVIEAGDEFQVTLAAESNVPVAVLADVVQNGWRTKHRYF